MTAQEYGMDIDWAQADIEVGGKTLHYYRTGGKGKPRIVLTHGFTDNGLCWMEVARALEPEWDVIMPDMRGHGLSARVKPGEDVDMPADLAGFIRALRLDKPVLCGHSMGGHDLLHGDRPLPRARPRPHPRGSALVHETLA
jgi:pimeloyl-ACP methyl ester carboxylesterase